MASLEITKKSEVWIEVARSLKNKGIVHVMDLWDKSKVASSNFETLKENKLFLILELVLNNRTLEKLSKQKGKPQIPKRKKSNPKTQE